MRLRGSWCAFSMMEELMCGSSCVLIIWPDRLELALLLAETELRPAYELSDSVPEAIRLVVDVVFLPPVGRENRGPGLVSCSLETE